MRWLLPLLVAVGIMAAAIVPAWQDRAEAVGRVIVPTCAEDLGAAADVDGSTSLTWRLRLADDVGGMLLDLTDAQLIGLGFDRHAVGMIGRERPADFEWPKPRPVWVRLRPDSGAGGRLVVDTVAATWSGARGTAGTVVVRARIGFSARGEPAVATEGAAMPVAPPPKILHADLLELIPGLLHLTPAQDAAVRGVRAGMECHGSPLRAAIAMGRRGSLWVERIDRE